MLHKALFICILLHCFTPKKSIYLSTTGMCLKLFTSLFKYKSNLIFICFWHYQWSVFMSHLRKIQMLYSNIIQYWQRGKSTQCTACWSVRQIYRRAVNRHARSTLTVAGSMVRHSGAPGTPATTHPKHPVLPRQVNIHILWTWRHHDVIVLFVY